MIDKDILQACIRRDEKACKTLYFKLYNLLMSVSMRYQRNEIDAKDCVNVTFIKVIDGLSEIDLNRPIEGWVRRICINENIDQYRKYKKHNESLNIDNPETVSMPQITVESEAFEQMLSYEDVLDMVKKLPDTTSKVFNLYVIDGYKHREIAELLDISEGTSRWHLSYARQSLKETISEEIKRHKMIIYGKE